VSSALRSRRLKTKKPRALTRGGPKEARAAQGGLWHSFGNWAVLTRRKNALGACSRGCHSRPYPRVIHDGANERNPWSTSMETKNASGPWLEPEAADGTRIPLPSPRQLKQKHPRECAFPRVSLSDPLSREFLSVRVSLPGQSERWMNVAWKTKNRPGSCLAVAGRPILFPTFSQLSPARKV